MDADASMCKDGSLPSVPPRKLPILPDKAAACGGRMVTSGRCPHVPKPAPCAVAFDKCLPFSRLTGQLQVSVATCTGKTGTRMRARLILYTQATGHPLPVARYARGGLSSVVTERRREEGRALVARQGQTFRREKRGNGDGQSVPA